MHSKLWSTVAITCLGALVVAALLLPQSFLLTAFSDLIQCLLLISGTLSFMPHVLKSQGRMRLFWALMTAGIAFWLFYQLLWTYFEVVLRQDVPNVFAGDIVLFLHIVPLMAALALRPHVPQDEYAARLGRLDFVLLTLWWIYLYIFIVIPWQYVVTNEVAYGWNLNAVYLFEKLAFLVALSGAWIRSKGRWRTFYGHLFGASLTYAAGSYVANWALTRQAYYSGSLYDIPLVASMAWITLIGVWTRGYEPDPASKTASTAYGVWVPRLGMIAVFSLPLFAAWTLSHAAIPMRISWFRLGLTLGAALVMGIMVFVRQHFLDRELVRLLNHSRDSVENLKQLQAQIVESEKLASIGQLVGGAAHELNNPITAMLGYSDLLMATTLTPEQHELAARIGQHARRTRSLVASLLSFAKQGPVAMVSIDLNALLRTAVKLSQPQWQGLNLEVRTELSQDVLLVRGDSNQLLQVCVQIINDALHAVHQRTIRTLTIAAERKDGLAIINIYDTELAQSKAEMEARSDAGVEDDQTLSDLGLNACQGILRQHHGRISWQQDRNAGTSIRVELPVMPAAPEKSTGAGVPVMWQPQPSA